MLTLAAMDYQERLAHAMELAELLAHGGSSQLARAIGTTPQAITQVLRGSSKALTAENTARAAKFLKVDWFWLATGEGAPRPYVDEAGIDVGRRFCALPEQQQRLLLAQLARLEQGGG